MELSLNYCSHDCFYCFANLNNPERKADVRSIWNFIKNVHKSKSIEAWFIREGYPILFSNLVDPFAGSNINISIPIIEAMDSEGYRFSFQTKGWKTKFNDMERLVSKIQKSVFYFSITSDIDEINLKYEPNAPVYSERIKLVELVKSFGHKVIFGLNPYCREWFNSIDSVIGHCNKIWASHIHINRDQRSMLGNEYDSIIDAKRDFDDLHVLGDSLYIPGKSKSNVFNDYPIIYKKTMPVMTEFDSFLREKNKSIVYFEDFINFIGDRIPLKYSNSNMQGYLFSSQKYRKRIGNIPNKISYMNILKFFWNEPMSLNSVTNYDNFKYIIGEDGYYIEDGKKNNVVYFADNTGNNEIDIYQKEVPYG